MDLAHSPGADFVRIALFTKAGGERGTDTLLNFAWKNLLREHRVLECRLEVGVSETEALKAQDLILVTGTAFLDGKGTFISDLNSLKVKTPVVCLGIRVPLDARGVPLRNETELSFLSTLLEQSRPLSAEDPTSVLWLNRWLGEGAAILTGNALLHFPFFLKRVRMPRGVLCPRGEANEKTQVFEKNFRDFWGAHQVLFVAIEKEDLGSGVEAGLCTLYSPLHPEVIVEALTSATVILTSRLEAALVGCASAVPSLVADLSFTDAAFAEWLGVPVFSGELALDLKNYPHTLIAERVQQLKARLSQCLRDVGVVPVKEIPDPPLSICCIADEGYLPHLTGLIENLRAVHRGELQFYILALDASVRRFLDEQYGDLIRVYDLGELWGTEELQRIRSRRVADQAYSSKSKLLLRALADSKAAALLYCDLDLYFFKSPAHLQSDLGSKSVLLFPHWNDSLKHCKMYGVFNAGMVLVSSGAQNFLEWWSKMCLDYYSTNKNAGYWVDQGFLDLAPTLFDSVGIYRRGDENVAFWNIETLSPAKAKDDIGSYHAAGADRLGLFEAKFCWDQVANFYSSFQGRYHPGFPLSVFLQQKNYLPEANRSYYLHYFLHKLVPGAPFLLPRQVQHFFSRSVVRHLMETVLWFYRHYRAMVNWVWPSPIVSESHWVALQRRFLS